MLGTVAVTDFGWYEHLAVTKPSEVNFWTPSDRRPFSAPTFSPFFFKLKAPYRAIAGFGYFAKWSSLPDWLAWDCFGSGNGYDSLDDLRRSIARIRLRIGYTSDGPTNIGCILIVQPTFFPKEAWVQQPSDWSDRIVTTRSYDLDSGEGERVWRACVERAGMSTALETILPQVTGLPEPRYGVARPVAPRLGQGTFRVEVLDAYSRACAVTQEHSLPALEAVHIRSYSKAGPHDVRNGLLLRADLHRLFDKGYVTVTVKNQLEVSPRLRKDYSNGRSYYPLHGTALSLPRKDQDQPSADYLSWHNDNVYLG
jgi:putative restriction endonuclease